MEIWKILTESPQDLYPEDLDFFETELATGGPYEPSEQARCREKIKELRAWMDGELPEPLGAEAETKEERDPAGAPKGLLLSLQQLAPAEANPAASAMTPVQILESDIRSIRTQSACKTAFKEYIKANPQINSDFLDAHFGFFQPWEMNAIVSCRQLDEAFLEKYFGALDHDKIARHQCFSESFFMRHFAQLDPAIVLEHGKNEWRKKEKRSSQLDVFLRLKGVKI